MEVSGFKTPAQTKGLQQKHTMICPHNKGGYWIPHGLAVPKNDPKQRPLQKEDISWVWPPHSNSDHQDYYIFSIPT